MSSGHLARGAAKALALVLALGLFIAWGNRDLSIAHEGAESGDHPHAAHRPEAIRRESFLSSRHGLQFGVPKQAISGAVSRMRAMERASSAQLNSTSAAALNSLGGASAPALTLNGSWLSVGPSPMSEKANFTGSAVGNATAMTGRLTALAADANGLIVVGAASGGLWVSPRTAE